MQQEIKESAEKASLAIAGTGASWSLQDINTLVSIGVGVLTCIFILFQLAKLVRLWYLTERERESRKLLRRSSNVGEESSPFPLE